MYLLLVYFPEDDVARATIPALNAAEVLSLIPQLLAEHAGCEHIVVKGAGVRLFSVDCEGNRLP